MNFKNVLNENFNESNRVVDRSEWNFNIKISRFRFIDAHCDVLIIVAIIIVPIHAFVE